MTRDLADGRGVLAGRNLQPQGLDQLAWVSGSFRIAKGYVALKEGT